MFCLCQNMAHLVLIEEAKLNPVFQMPRLSETHNNTQIFIEEN